MAARPVWEGHLRLSLVTCPVRLFKATGEGEAVHFNLLHRQTLNRVRQFYRDEADGEVARGDLVRGFQIEKDRYVVVEDEELKALRLESTRVIDIERFVRGDEIDRLYWDQPYYLVPDGKPAQEPYAVIREAMRGEGQVALGRLVMTGRERIVAMEPRGKGMLLTTLHSHDEVRADEELFDAVADVAVSKPMVDIARQIIAQAQGPFAPEEFRDRYQDAVRELVERKAAGERPVHRPAAEPESNVVDLMEALRRSLKGGDAASGRAAGRAQQQPEPRTTGRGAAKDAAKLAREDGPARASKTGARTAAAPRRAPARRRASG
jgi:DNA end-binding protein Ku